MKMSKWSSAGLLKKKKNTVGLHKHTRHIMCHLVLHFYQAVLKLKQGKKKVTFQKCFRPVEHILR